VQDKLKLETLFRLLLVLQGWNCQVSFG